MFWTRAPAFRRSVSNARGLCATRRRSRMRFRPRAWFCRRQKLKRCCPPTKIGSFFWKRKMTSSFQVRGRCRPPLKKMMKILRFFCFISARVRVEFFYETTPQAYRRRFEPPEFYQDHHARHGRGCVWRADAVACGESEQQIEHCRHRCWQRWQRRERYELLRQRKHCRAMRRGFGTLRRAAEKISRSEILPGLSQDVR